MTPFEMADKVADLLQGQCLLDIPQALEELEFPPEMQDDRDFLHALDNLVFLCADCGWWCEISEEADPETIGRYHDTICDDCAE